MAKLNEKEALARLEKIYGGTFRRSTTLDVDFPKEEDIHLYEFSTARCPICQKSGWCMVNLAGNKVFCERYKQGKAISTYKDHWVHVKKIKANESDLFVSKGKIGAADIDYSTVRHYDTSNLAKPDILDLFNRSILLAYPLTQQHKQNLLKRGLPEEWLQAAHPGRGFGSVYYNDPSNPKKPYVMQAKGKKENGKFVLKSRWLHMIQAINKQLSVKQNASLLKDNSWRGVPGFRYLKKTLSDGKEIKFPYFQSHQGMLVPYYDEFNRIVGFQVRVDHQHWYVNSVVQPPKDSGYTVDVHVPKNTNQYFVYCHSKHSTEDQFVTKGTVTTEDTIKQELGQKPLTYPYSFTVNQTAKYYWVSSSKEDGGAIGPVPIQVSYNETIAGLDPTKQDENGNYSELETIKKYIAKPKSIWLTEGGLKAIVATALLPSNFNNHDLTKYGRDFLAVAGVNSFRKFLPMLRKLNVHEVTTAYDMDWQSNDQVKSNYKELIKMLEVNHFKIHIACWDLDQAKGIDDALAKHLKIQFVTRDYSKQ